MLGLTIDFTPTRNSVSEDLTSDDYYLNEIMQTNHSANSGSSFTSNAIRDPFTTPQFNKEEDEAEPSIRAVRSKTEQHLLPKLTLPGRSNANPRANPKAVVKKR